MLSQANSHNLLIEINISDKVLSGFHKVKDFLAQTTDNLAEQTQRAKATLVDADTADKMTAIAQQAQVSVVENIDKTKDSLEQTLQTFGQLKHTTEDAIGSAIASNIGDWIQNRPIVLRLVQILAWASDRPILSLVILLFILAIAVSLIKSIGRLFENFWLAILQIPFNLGKFLFLVSYQSFSKISSLIIKSFSNDERLITSVQEFTSDSNEPNNQQRLLEISTRLEEIRQEQNELLQEAAAILTEISEVPNTQHKQILFKN